MAKKAKRKVSAVVTPAPAPEVADVEVVERTTTPARQAQAAPRTFGRRAPVTVEFNPDYTYIVKDLKRIGTLAGTFFILLIILSFIIK